MILFRGPGIEPLLVSNAHMQATRIDPLENHKVVSDVRVPGPTTQWVDGLLRDIELGRSVLGVGSTADSVDLLVHLCTLMVTVLTGTSDRVHDLGRVPSSDTGDLSETSVGLSLIHI